MKIRNPTFRFSILLQLVTFVVGYGFVAGLLPHYSIAENLPEIRPALVGSGPSALVNLIDTNHLMQSGLTHGAVFFRTFITPDGNTYGCLAYGGTPGSDALRREVRIRLERAHFIPAVYNHRNTYAFVYGTVTFSVLDGKPHLRIYSSQEKSELAEGHDFIGPQSVDIPGHLYDPTKYPEGSWWSEERPATVEIELTVGADGKLKDVRALQENQPGKKFAENALKNIRNCTFLPAFRNGRPVESTTHYTYVFIPSNSMWKF